MSNPRKPLSPEEQALITELHARGHGYRAIANITGRSKSTVQYFLTSDRKEKKETSLTPEQDALILQGLAEHKTFASLGDELGVSRDKVRTRARKIGAKSFRYFDWNEENDARVQQLLSEGMSFSLVGKQLGTSKGSVMSRARLIGAKSRVPSSHKMEATSKRPRNRTGLRKERGLSVVHVGKLSLPSLPSITEAPATPVQEPVAIPDKAPAQQPYSAPTGLGGATCQYPLWGDYEAPTHRYCDAPIPLGQSWCAKCRRIVFYTVSQRRAA